MTTLWTVRRTLLAAWALSAAGCTDGLFVAGAPPDGRAGLAIATTSALGGSASAFDRADAIRVRVSRMAYPVLDSSFAFRSAGNETRVSVAVELKSSEETLDIAVELSGGAALLFRGNASISAKKGETTPVTIPLTPVASALRLASIPTFTALGDTAWAHGAVVFSSGDTIRALRVGWLSQAPEIVSAGPDSMLVARAEGVAQLQGTYGTLTQTVPVTVSATVTSVVLTPRDISLYIAAAPFQFSAVARDRRGNALVRTIAFSSRDTTVVRIDSRGVAWAVRTGATYVVAAFGSVRDSTRVTVPGGGVFPPGPYRS